MGSNMSTIEESRAHVTTSTTVTPMTTFGPHFYAHSNFVQNQHVYRDRRATSTSTPTSVVVQPCTIKTTNRIMTFHSNASWNGFLESSKAFNNLVVAYFSNAWYEPCRYMEPTFEEFAAKYTNVEFVKINVDELHDLSRHYGVRETPTFVLIKRGKVIDKVVGPRKDELQRKIEKHRA